MGEFYKMEYDAWDEGTVELSLEEEAAYLRLCHQMYRRRQPVPVYDRMLAALWRCHPNKARPLLQRLIEKKKVVLLKDGRVTNARTMREIEARKELSKTRSDAGHTGGTRRAQNLTRTLDAPHKTPDAPQKSLNLLRVIQADSSRGEEKREEENRKEGNAAVASSSRKKISMPHNFEPLPGHRDLARGLGWDDRQFDSFVSWWKHKQISDNGRSANWTSALFGAIEARNFNILTRDKKDAETYRPRAAAGDYFNQ